MKVFENAEVKMYDFMKAHPKATSTMLGASTALALGGAGIVASADDPTTTESTDVVDTIVSSMSSTLSGVAGKVIPAAVSVGVVFVAAGLAWKWFKKMSHG